MQCKSVPADVEAVRRMVVLGNYLLDSDRSRLRLSPAFTEAFTDLIGECEILLDDMTGRRPLPDPRALLD